jgi:hypothetical protein
MEFGELKSRVGINTEHVVWAEDDEGNVYTIKLSAMMTEVTALNLASTWAEVDAILMPSHGTIYAGNDLIPPTMFVIEDGKVRIVPSHYVNINQTGPKIISTSHNLGIISGYGTRKQPGLRNNQNLKWHLPDVIFSHKDLNNKVVNFDNCIPIINGKVHLPLPFANELFVLDGTKVLKTAPPTQANILMDFTSMGGFRIVRFKDCERLTDKALPSFVLPEDVSLKGKSFVSVLAGRFFMQSEVKQLGDRTVVYTPQVYNLDNIRLSNKQLERDLHDGTSITSTPASDDYFDIIQGEDHTESFIIIFETPGMTFHFQRPLFGLTDRMLKFPPSSGGLLIRQTTREVVDYSRQFDTDGTITFINEPVRTNKLMTEYPGQEHNISYGHSKAPNIDYNISGEQAGYVLLDIMDKGDS